MPTCFVIQPFDSGKFDKRFDEIFRPALKQAGLDPYRVDQDPSVQVTIDSIHEGIRSAAICLADITMDNPNVWYELGFALALGHDVILICSDERQGKYPFDIHHRNVIKYETGSRSGFDQLQQSITDKAEALLRKGVARRVVETEQVAPQEGLSQIEIMVLAVAAGSASIPGTPIGADFLKSKVENSGLTGVGYGVAISRLEKNKFVEFGQDTGEYGDAYPVIALSDIAWTWIAENEHLFKVTKGGNRDSDFADDIPF
ncbi:MAG: hypothetical protein OXJ90_27260 [Spirochaetaceae bacterium]|nr:hypothetical protein [Spirochaetaceae bacterium]